MVLTVILAGCGKKAESAADGKNAQTEKVEASQDVSADTETGRRPESYGTIELGEYKGLEITKSEVSVSEQEIETCRSARHQGHHHEEPVQ